MNKYLNGIRKEVLSYQNVVEKLTESKEKLVSDYQNGNISKNDYEDKLGKLGNKTVENDTQKAFAAIEKILEEYRNDLEQWATLKAEDLTDDTKLFNTPIQLSPNDYEALEEKYKDNYSMLRMIKDHAAIKDVYYHQSYSIDKEEKARNLYEVVTVAQNVIKTVKETGRKNYMGLLWEDEEKFNTQYVDEGRIILL